MEPLTTPVLFLVFRRVETTRRVFAAIRQARPRTLFIVADGPREDRPEEAAQCEEARDVVREVDWDCDVHTRFHDRNVGLRLAVTSGLDWFFEHVDEGIVLEDDCLPSQSFFRFCQELLARYRDDTRVMEISGDNFQFGRRRGDGSYYFSRLGGIWGWATWRRAWRCFDPGLSTFPKFEAEGRIRSALRDRIAARFWMTKIEEARRGGGTWAFAWVYALLSNNGLCICPNDNLVSNIGFGPAATHSQGAGSVFTDLPRHEIAELVHPTFMMPDEDADTLFSRLVAREQMPPRIDGEAIASLAWRLARHVIPERRHDRVKRMARKLMAR